MQEEQAAHMELREETASRWNTTLSVLLHEWRSLSASDESIIARWTERLESIREEQRQLRASGAWLSGPADFLSIIRRSRREIDHCRMIAWLLDPMMPHRLGPSLVLRVLRRCFPEETFDPKALMTATVQCEVSHENGRADIVLHAPGLSLVIEAKIDHTERLEQCADLQRDFGGRDARFIFLTVDGRPPETATACADFEFASLSFAALLDELRASIRESGVGESIGADAVRTYAMTLEREFT